MAPWRKNRLPPLTKWMGLVAAIWVQAFAGNSFVYADYSSSLKSILNLNQVQLNYLALSKDFGENVGILAGLLCNKLPPWVILSIAALEGFLGFGAVWLVASGTVDPCPLWQMCLALCVGSNSTTWYNTAVLVTCMRNFPNTRGTIVGFLKGFIGLSGAIFTQIFNSLLGSDPIRLILFLALGPTSVCLLSMGFIRPVKPRSPGLLFNPEEEKQFRFIYIICVALAVYLLITVFVDHFVGMQVVSKIIVSVMLLFLFAPVIVPIRVLTRRLIIRSELQTEYDEANISSVDTVTEPLISSENSDTIVKKEGDNEAEAKLTAEPRDEEGTARGSGLVQRRGVANFLEPEEEDANTLLAIGEGAVRRKKRRPRRGEDFKLKQALIKADFWLLFMTFFCGVGTAITAGNNLSQVGQAQGYESVSIFVQLSSIWGFIGRLGGGALSERFVRSSLLPRPVWIAAALCLLIVDHLLYAFPFPGSLYPASSLMGFCYGVQIAAMVPTISEIFGLKHFGILYNFIALADPVASLLFSTLLTGTLYDLEVQRQYGVVDTADLVCTGAHCFRLTFLILAAVCVVGVALCIVLSIRLIPVYASLYGAQDSANASYSSLPSANASYSSLPPASANAFNFQAAGTTSLSPVPSASQLDQR